MEFNFTGIIVAIATFLIIGLFHPIVIKSEYYWGVRCWWAFMILGIISLIASLLIDNFITSMILGVLGITLFWSILEIFEQRERVRKGWFPKNPKRESEY
ncbi:MAG: DUF4491 family protein [Rikenellaceae bacterium]